MAFLELFHFTSFAYMGSSSTSLANVFLCIFCTTSSLTSIAVIGASGYIGSHVVDMF